jgi:hypothetical protein
MSSYGFLQEMASNNMGWKDEMVTFDVKKDILGTPSISTVSIKQNWYVEVDFKWLGSTCSFVITRWMSKNAVESFRLFFKEYDRDPNVFGFITDEGSLNITAEQKRMIIKQCYEDIVSAIELIVRTYQKCLLDYAVWYRDKRPAGKVRNTYSEFITTIACDCIVHGEILASNEWKLVEYP